MDILHHYKREELIGPNSWKYSDLGLVQFKHGYDKDLLATIRKKAVALKESFASPSVLGSSYIRSPHLHIPELKEFLYRRERIAQLEQFTKTPIEVYPIPIATCFIHFMGVTDGNLGWHSDAVPSLEIINLELDDIEGAEMEIFVGSEGEGRSLLKANGTLPEEKLIRVTPRLDYSVFGQFTRTLHRTGPISRGTRVVLLIAHRSIERPYIDDNNLWFLGADNPDFEWLEDFVKDTKERKMPAYLRDKAVGAL